MEYLDNQPLNYWKQKAIYLTLYCTGALALGTVVTAIVGAARGSLNWMVFSPAFFLHGAFWQPLTYVLVNPVNFFTPMSLCCFYFWGVEVEKYLGRRFFLGLCAALVVTPALFLLLFSPVAGGGAIAGNFPLIIGLLIAFATLYPDLDYFGWVPLKWFAFACVVCGSIMFLPDHDWGGLAGLWLNCFVAFAMVRSARGLFDWKLPGWLGRGPKLRVVPREAPPIRGYVDTTSTAEREMNALLDKIAQGGIASLTPAEQARLEVVRGQMLRKES